MRDISYLLFDLDGTLIDTTALILHCFRETLNSLGIPLRPDTELLSQVGRPLRLQMRDIDPQREEELVDTYARLYDRYHDELARGIPGMEEIIAELHGRGYHMAIVTSKRSRAVHGELEHFGLARFFELVIAADDTDRHKPDPEPVLAAVTQLGGSPGQATYIGDSPFDIRSAHAAGVLAGAVEWSPFRREILEAEEPDYWIPTPGSLLEMFPGVGSL
jgi:pyrophosphatase PpaX